MNIMITGANGTIGSDLVEYFSKKNKIFAFYRTPNNFSKKLKNKNIYWIRHDLKKEIYHKINPEIIIHSVVVHPFSKKDAYLDYLNSNIIALKNVIEFAKSKKINKLFYLSSVKIYGKIQEKILTDENIFCSPDILGATKILAEKMIELQKFSYLNIRLPGVLCYNISDSKRPWLNMIINRLIKNQKIEIHNSKNLFNNIIDTYEIFKFINHLIKKKKIINGTINFSAIKPIKIESMIYHLKRKLFSTSKIIFNKKKTNHFIISSKKINNLYRFKISTTFQIIDRYIDLKYNKKDRYK